MIWGIRGSREWTPGGSGDLVTRTGDPGEYEIGPGDSLPLTPRARCNGV